MKSIKLFVVLLTILWQINCDESNEDSNDDNESDSMLDLICFLTFPNAIIKTDDKTFYLLFHKHFWILDFDSNTNKLMVRDSNATQISTKWSHLPNDIDFGFTIERSSYGNPIAGHTLFVKKNHYYLYRNQTFVKEGNTLFWEPQLWLNWRYLVTLRNSSLVLLATKGDIISSISSGKAFKFDSEDYPEILSEFSILSERIDFDLNDLKYLFPLPFGNKYLAVFQTRGEGFYCVLQNLSDQCIYEPIHQIFKCPAHILVTKQNDWIHWVWNRFGLNINQLVLIICGSSIAVLAINLLLFIVSFERFIQMV